MYPKTPMLISTLFQTIILHIRLALFDLVVNTKKH